MKARIMFRAVRPFVSALAGIATSAALIFTIYFTRLGLEWAYAKTPLMTRLELAHCEEIAKDSGLPPELVLATGATRLDQPT